MPLHIDASLFGYVCRAAAVVHTESECYIEIDATELRFYVQADDRTLYFHYTLPRSDPRVSGEITPGKCCLRLDSIIQFLRAIDSSELRITLPFETSDSQFIIDSDGPTYHGHSVVLQYGHPVPDVPDVDPTSTCSIPHAAITKGVTVAGIIGNELQVRLEPDTPRVTFAAEQPGGDDCKYVVSADYLDHGHDHIPRLTIPIGTLQELIQKLPSDARGTLRLTSQYLQYTMSFPDTRDTLTLYIAKRTEAILR